MPTCSGERCLLVYRNGTYFSVQGNGAHLSTVTVPTCPGERLLCLLVYGNVSNYGTPTRPHWASTLMNNNDIGIMFQIASTLGVYGTGPD